MHGSRQSIGIASTPSGASVFIDGEARGETPLTVKLRRKVAHELTISKAGYFSYVGTIKNKFSKWVWGSAVLGGLVGVGIDVLGGGAFKLIPQDLAVDLKAVEAAVTEAK